MQKVCGKTVVVDKKLQNKNLSGFSFYNKELAAELDKIDPKQVDKLAKIIYEAYKKNKTVYFAGNGGSAATASHWATDIQKTVILKNYKRPDRIKTISLADNVSLITAWANDYDFNHIFSEQLAALATKDDVLIAISGSGNSPNIIEALKQAKKLEMVTFALLGFKGGDAGNLTKNKIVVTNSHYGIIEDIHMILCHSVTEILKIKFNKK